MVHAAYAACRWRYVFFLSRALKTNKSSISNLDAKVFFLFLFSSNRVPSICGREGGRVAVFVIYSSLSIYKVVYFSRQTIGHVSSTAFPQKRHFRIALIQDKPKTTKVAFGPSFFHRLFFEQMKLNWVFKVCIACVWALARVLFYEFQFKCKKLRKFICKHESKKSKPIPEENA